jgi:predicted ATPase/DNA-binding CsgD family transcriptional regulator
MYNQDHITEGHYVPFPNNLPPELTSFVGRRREMAEIRRLLANPANRLLTLTGTGGCGKTRLALRAASHAVKEYRDGVWFVDLASLADPMLMPQAVASALGVGEQPERTLMETLIDELKPKKLLLVLDNCEHLLEACSSLVGTLLRDCPNLRVLATSRQALDMAEETSWRVPSLSLPDLTHLPALKELGRYDAIRLFGRRAQLRRENFDVTSGNAVLVAQVCHQLDGIPLAIELAAARISVLSVDELLERLGERFRLLISAEQATVRRHQTLQATLDWSYDLLSPAEQILSRGLSVFAGGCTLEAVEAICGIEIDEYQTITLLAQLVGKSLVIREERAGRSRYRMLETIRQHGNEKLRIAGELTDLQYRHAEWYREFAESIEPELTSGPQAKHLEMLEQEHDNIRAALRLYVEMDNAAMGLRLAGAVWRFWYLRGYMSEGREQLSRMLSIGQSRVSSSNLAGNLAYDLSRAKVLHGMGVLTMAQNDYSTAISMLNKSLAIRRELSDKEGTARSLMTLGVLAYLQADYLAARTHYEECLMLFREIKDLWGISSALSNLSVIAMDFGGYDEAYALTQESLGLKRQLGDQIGIALSLMNLGFIAQKQGKDTTARPLITESLSMLRVLGNKRALSGGLHVLGILAQRQGDYETAHKLYQESLALYKETGEKAGIASLLNNQALLANELGDSASAIALCHQSLELVWELEDREGIIECFENLALITGPLGNPELGARLLSASEALREIGVRPRTPVGQSDYEHKVASVRTLLDKESFERVWAEGRTLSLDEAYKLAVQVRPGLGETVKTSMQGVEVQPNDLTGREVELLRLVAAGLRNKEIAGQLTLSKSTVETHLHSIYSKLGVTSRAAAARFAVEHNLL